MQKQLQAPNILHREDLKSLGNATGPCVSLYFEEHMGEKMRHDAVRLHNATEAAENRLRERGLDTEAIGELLDPIRELANNLAPWHIEGNAFAVFRSPDVFRVYRPMKKVRGVSVVGEHFYVVPIIDMMKADRHFYILALSQNHVRLLRCTEYASEEVPLPPGTPASLEQWLNTRMPDADQQHTPPKPDKGAPLGSFTSATDRDRKDAHLTNFFNAVDKAIFQLLREETTPLVVAATDDQVNLYRRLTKYGHITDAAVSGSPESLKGGELHARALPVVQEYWNQPQRKALQMYEDAGGTDRRVDGVVFAARAAYEGRIAHLFVADRAREMGRFSPETLEVQLEPNDNPSAEDMVNFAALQTLLHGGEVWVLPAEKVPGHNQVAGVCRY